MNNYHTFIIKIMSNCKDSNVDTKNKNIKSYLNDEMFNDHEEIDDVDYQGSNIEEHNFEDYVVTEDEIETNHREFFNVFLCYFKQINRRERNENMFSHIKHDEQYDFNTNKCIETFYEHIELYNKSNDTSKDILNLTSDGLLSYVLNINDKPLYTCNFLIPIIVYVSDLDWYNVNWSIWINS